MCDPFGTNAALQQTQQAATDAANATQAQETARQAAIAQGKTSIDDAYSQFTPDYYKNYEKTYTAAQDAPVADQYAVAKDQLTAALAGRDTLGSSGGNNALAMLSKTNADTQAQIGANATDAANTLRSNVNNSKNSMYAENTAAADPLAAASNAQATAQTLVAPQSVPTMSGVFAGALAPYATAAKVGSQAMYPNSTPNMNAPLSGAGSSVTG